MKCSMRRCTACGRYSLERDCPACGAPTECPLPARYSPEDRYGKYRRQTMKD